MNSWHSYPKVYNLGHPHVDQLLDGPVAVQEKVDGSQFSFGNIDGVLRVKSKSQEIDVDAPPKMFAEAVKTVQEKAELLLPGYTYRGEVLQKPKHNALAYDRVPNGHIILFDVEVDYCKFMPPEIIEKEARRLGLESVPLYHVGAFVREDIDKFLETESVLGGQKVEGIVIKNYARFSPDGKVMMGKYVNPKFRELNKKSWRDANPTKGDIIADLVGQIRTEARWEKAVIHMAERGELTHSPKDIGPLIGEVARDTKAECDEMVRDALAKWAWKRLGRAVTAGLAEWYKDRLMLRQFEEEVDVDAPEA